MFTRVNIPKRMIQTKNCLQGPGPAKEGQDLRDWGCFFFVGFIVFF